MSQMENRYKQLGQNTLWMIVGNFATKLISFFMVPLYTAYLSTADYGIADLMTTTVSLLSPMLTIAASEGVLRFTLQKENDDRQVLSLSLNISLIGFVLLLLASPFVQPHVAFKDYYSLFLLYYISNNVLWITQQYVKGIDLVKHYAISGFLSTLGSVLANILFLTVFRIGIRGYLYAQILACVVPVLYLVFMAKLYRRLVLPTAIPRTLLRRYLLYCLPLIPNQLSWWINNSSDKYILNFYWGLSLTGIYSVAYKIPTILNVVGGIFASSWQISSVEDFGSEESKEFYSSVYKKYFSLFAIVSALIILFIRVLAKILFSNEFYNAWPYAALLVLASMLQAMGQFYETIYLCAMKPAALLYTTILAAVVNTGLNFLLIPQFGAGGAACATILGYMAMYGIRAFASKRIFRFKVYYLQNIVTFALLAVETAVICCQTPGWIGIAAVAAVAIIVVNRSVLADIWRVGIKMLHRQ